MLENGYPVVLGVLPGNKEYDYLPSIGFMPSRVAMLGNKSPLLVTPCPYYREFENTGTTDFEYITEHATMRGVKANRTNVQISLEKCNSPNKYPNDDLQVEVEKQVYEYMGPILTTTMAGPDSNFEINNSTSPAKQWKERGCKDKAEALAHPDMPDAVWGIDHVPIIDYNGKVEFLEQTEIVNDKKIRGTFNPPLDLLLKEKLFFDNQNKNVKDNNQTNWIKYGFVKQYGGFHRLGLEMEEYDYHDEDDVTGYDRVISMVPTYRMRTHFLSFPDKFYLMYCYVVQFVLYAIVACPDGVLRKRLTGNISGSNSTTVNNSIAHLFILFRFIHKFWLIIVGRIPTLQEILFFHKYNIYSDDAFGGHKIRAILELSDRLISYDQAIVILKTLKVETYAEFGAILKPKQHFSSEGSGRLNQAHSFLGSSFHFDELLGMYVPYPRINKLASSLKYTLKPLNPVDQITKVFAITILAGTVPRLHKECVTFLNFLLDTYKFKHGELPEYWISLARIAVDTPTVWYLNNLGRESNGALRRSVFENDQRSQSKSTSSESVTSEKSTSTSSRT